MLWELYFIEAMVEVNWTGSLRAMKQAVSSLKVTWDRNYGIELEWRKENLRDLREIENTYTHTERETT